jgi:hypothetical protein
VSRSSPSVLTSGYRELSLGLKRLGRNAGHSHPSSADAQGDCTMVLGGGGGAGGGGGGGGGVWRARGGGGGAGSGDRQVSQSVSRSARQ